jgi:type II secretory ATPase GspE/PulE/Tfp pilus assembly ATPase PilB-like protein
MTSSSEPSGDFAELWPDQADAPEVVQQLIAQAERAGASDIHLHLRNGVAEIGLRLDGVLVRTGWLRPDLAARVFGRIKFLARLKTYQDNLPQDGRIDKADAGTKSDVRVATYPTVTGEKIVLRLFAAGTALGLGEIGLPDSTGTALDRALAQTTGTILLTGPAGSGKTTTIYACLQHVSAGGTRHIITIEDPVEQILPGIMQTEVNETNGLNYACAARHLLRQDPQVLVIGEIRDSDTATIVVRAALTGHLVIATLHAGSCRGVFERLLALCPDASAVATSTELVLNQRLVRRCCPTCQGKGCDACLKTGFRGRVLLVEHLQIGASERSAICTRDFGALKPERPLADQAQSATACGLTASSEISRVLGTAFCVPSPVSP